eukprot:700629_1
MNMITKILFITFTATFANVLSHALPHEICNIQDCYSNLMDAFDVSSEDGSGSIYSPSPRPRSSSEDTTPPGGRPRRRRQIIRDDSSDSPGVNTTTNSHQQPSNNNNHDDNNSNNNRRQTSLSVSPQRRFNRSNMTQTNLRGSYGVLAYRRRSASVTSVSRDAEVNSNSGGKLVMCEEEVEEEEDEVVYFTLISI